MNQPPIVYFGDLDELLREVARQPEPYRLCRISYLCQITPHSLAERYNFGTIVTALTPPPRSELLVAYVIRARTVGHIALPQTEAECAEGERLALEQTAAIRDHIHYTYDLPTAHGYLRVETERLHSAHWPSRPPQEDLA